MPCDALNSSDRSLDGGTGLLGSAANEDRHRINHGATDAVHDNSEAETCDQAATSGGENSLGNEKSKKKRSRKSKKTASENDESGKKKCKISEVPNQPAAKPPKKVPCAPRRKRCGNCIYFTILSSDCRWITFSEIVILPRSEYFLPKCGKLTFSRAKY